MGLPVSLKPSPVGKVAQQGRMRGRVCLSNPFMGNYSKFAPHQSAVGAADSFPLGGSQYSEKPLLLFSKKQRFYVGVHAPNISIIPLLLCVIQS